MNTQDKEWLIKSAKEKYTYNFSWMGRPVIQMPQDIVALQELIYDVRPTVVIETGVAHGGSLILYASMMKLLDIPGRVYGVEIALRDHNRAAIDAHPLASYIEIIDGSSTDPKLLENLRSRVSPDDKVLVVLDSDHTHDHVLAELREYGPLVTPGSYLVVMDTVVDIMPEDTYPDRHWGPKDNPWTAVRQYMAKDGNTLFEEDETIPAKLGLTMAPGGYLRRL